VKLSIAQHYLQTSAEASDVKRRPMLLFFFYRLETSIEGVSRIHMSWGQPG
jgi:hypothetical protein